MKKIKRNLMLHKIRPGFNKGKQANRQTGQQGFTLVELIIVIAIIAVLAVAAFMMLTKWLGKSRDSRRLGDLGTIARGLQVGYSDTDDGVNMYPTVKDQTGAISLLSGADTVVGYQGVVDNDVAGAASMQKAPVDPSDGSYYTYLVSQNRQKFQLLGFLEDGSEVGILNNTYALEYKNMTPTTKGFELGVLLRQSDNMPANLIGGGLTGVDLSAVGETEYKAIVNATTTRIGTGVLEIPLVDEDIVVLVGEGEGEGGGEEITLSCDDSTKPTGDEANIEYTIEPTSENQAYVKGGSECGFVCKNGYTGDNCEVAPIDNTSCETLYAGGQTTSRVYSIDPDGDGGQSAFDVYCNMDLNDGGWVQVMNIDTSDGHVVHWENTDFWTSDTSGYGAVANSLTSDYKNLKAFKDFQATKLLVVVHEEGVMKGWKSYNLVGTNTISSYFNGGNNIQLTSSTIASNIASINSGEPTIKNNSNLYVNTIRGRDNTDLDRISIGGNITDNYGGGLGTWYDSNIDRQRPRSDAQLLNCAWVGSGCRIGSDYDSAYAKAARNYQSALNYDYAIYVK